VSLDNIKPAEAKKLTTALKVDFLDSCYYHAETKQYSCDAEFSISCSDQEFARDIAERIWKTIKRYVLVDITATYLEDLPYEAYEFDEDDYEVVAKEIARKRTKQKERRNAKKLLRMG
jgi:hypothetical protein